MAPLPTSHRLKAWNSKGNEIILDESTTVRADWLAISVENTDRHTVAQMNEQVWMVAYLDTLEKHCDVVRVNFADPVLKQYCDDYGITDCEGNFPTVVIHDTRNGSAIQTYVGKKSASEFVANHGFVHRNTINSNGPMKILELIQKGVSYVTGLPTDTAALLSHEIFVSYQPSIELDVNSLFASAKLISWKSRRSVLVAAFADEGKKGFNEVLRKESFRAAFRSGQFHAILGHVVSLSPSVLPI